MAAITEHYAASGHMSKTLLDDGAFLISLVQQDIRILACLPESSKADGSLILAGIEKDARAFEHAGYHLQRDPTFILKAMQRNSAVFDSLPLSMRIHPYLIPKIEAYIDPGATIYCNQERIADEFEKNGSSIISQKVKAIKTMHGGLCDIICNYVIVKDALEGGLYDDKDQKGGEFRLTPTLRQRKSPLGSLGMFHKPPKHLKFQRLSLSDTPTILESHILHTTPFWKKVRGYLFSIYPYSLLSFGEQRKIQQGGKVDQCLLGKKLFALPTGRYVKFFTFSTKACGSVSGHSMLIKKSEENFSFFDPGEGECPNLSFIQLCCRINTAMARKNVTNIAFLDGQQYISSLKLGTLTAEECEVTSALAL